MHATQRTEQQLFITIQATENDNIAVTIRLWLQTNKGVQSLYSSQCPSWKKPIDKHEGKQSSEWVKRKENPGLSSKKINRGWTAQKNGLALPKWHNTKKKDRKKESG